MLNFFYKCTFIISRTINTNIYLKFRIFDAIFNYFEYLEKIIKVNIYFLTNIVLKTCNKASTKLAKYYSKTKKLDNTLYNLVNILNFTQKISLYKLWNKSENDNTINYKNKYKIEFKNYYRRYYSLIANLKAKAQKANIAKEIIQYNNVYNFLLILI